MKVLLVGSGGVGESIAVIAKKRDPGSQWLEQMVLADYDAKRAIAVSQQLGDADRFPAEQVDANNADAVLSLIKKYTPDLIMNGCDPRFNPVLFDAAFKAGCNYYGHGHVPV